MTLPVRRLGELAVSAQGLGCMGMSQSYGPADRDESIATVHRALDLGITFVAYSPLGRGFLTGALKSPDDLAPNDWRRKNPRFQGENFQKNLELVEELESMARTKGTTPAQLALAWLLTRGDHVVPIPGSRRIERIEENAAAADITLAESELHRLELIAPVGAAAGTRYPEPMMAALNR